MHNASNIRELLSTIAENYRKAYKEDFTKHPLADFIRHYPKQIIEPLLQNNDLTVKGSPGMGQWTKSPWIGIFNKNETDGAQEGIYVVYLFSDNMERIYLTFNQGVTRLIDHYGRKLAHRKLKSKALDIRTNFEKMEDFQYTDKINLSEEPPGLDYEKSTIFFKEYKSNNLPSNMKLLRDLKKVVSFYDNYLVEDNIVTAYTDFSGSPGKVEEGKRVLRKHYARERNPKIVKDAKQKRMKEQGELHCDVCGFSFKETYGDHGNGFIEAHHIKPISEMLGGEKTSIKDIALVCSNCHRMIHRKGETIDIKKLKEIMS